MDVIPKTVIQYTLSYILYLELVNNLCKKYWDVSDYTDSLSNMVKYNDIIINFYNYMICIFIVKNHNLTFQSLIDIQKIQHHLENDIVP